MDQLITRLQSLFFWKKVPPRHLCLQCHMRHVIVPLLSILEIYAHNLTQQYIVAALYRTPNAVSHGELQLCQRLVADPLAED